MPLSRRRFLNFGVLAGLSAAGPAGAITLDTPQRPPRDPGAALGAFLDLLLPGDETPSATGVGTDAKVLAAMQGNARLDRLVRAGCIWLDREAGVLGATGFETLAGPAQETLIDHCARAPEDSLPRRFFETLRWRAFEHYYAQPEVCRNLGYPAPPQPAGFMDYSRAPADGV